MPIGIAIVAVVIKLKSIKTWAQYSSAGLTIGLRDALDLILLLDGVAVGGASGSVDDLIGEALRDSLHVAEGRFPGPGGHQVDGLVDAAERRHVNSLSSDHSCGAHASRVFARTTVYDCVHEHLHGVLVGQDADDLERMSHDSHSQQLLAVVSSTSHQRTSEALYDWALQSNQLR